jgi:hypothetical protein
MSHSHLLLYNRPSRGAAIGDWILRTFGRAALICLPERGARLLEEAAEAAQAAGLDRKKALKIVNEVFDRPVGDLFQEIGGVGVTLLGICVSAGIDADIAEYTEAKRVLEKPMEHFQIRNQDKIDRGVSALS